MAESLLKSFFLGAQENGKMDDNDEDLLETTERRGQRSVRDSCVEGKASLTLGSKVRQVGNQSVATRIQMRAGKRRGMKIAACESTLDLDAASPQPHRPLYWTPATGKVYRLTRPLGFHCK